MRHIFALSHWSRKLAASVACLLACTGGAHAALQGRDADGVAANGYEAFYDTVLNITWLADANYAKTSGFDLDGAMTWDKATSWVASLNLQGVTGWRLPHFEPVNGVSIVDYTPYWPDYNKGLIDKGFNITSPRNELSYMYYVNLHLLGTFSKDSELQMDTGFSSSGFQLVPDVPGAFISNLKSNMYWTNVLFQNESQKAWGLYTMYPAAGAHGIDYSYNDHYAWAVHDGDAFKMAVSTPTPAVDEPASAWLMLAGLGVSTFLMRRRNGIKSRAGVALA